MTGAESILESISDGVFNVDADWRITSFNRAAEAITGIRAALERCGYNRLEAARALGLHKSTLFRKIKTLGIDLPAQDGRTGTR